MKKLANLKEVNMLNKNEQKQINGGGICRQTTYEQCCGPYGGLCTGASGVVWSADSNDPNSSGECCVFPT